MPGMRVNTLNRMLVAGVISGVAAVGMSLPTNTQKQHQDMQVEAK
jgi:hypothetical protein